jgi:Pyruvate/2-oxoacid:ferredoxin oxidoreductase gamma subunit
MHMVERELLMTGIGGQGVQLAGQVLARAAIAEGLQVQLFGSYGGMMRGGNTDVTLVFADGPIEAPPTVSHAWSAIVMHPEHAAGVLGRVAEGGLVVVNSTVCTEPIAVDALVIEVPATDIAVEAGNGLAASIVIAGAFAAVTGIVGLDALEDAVLASLPSYRARHAELNARALQAGFSAAPAMSVPAR